MKNQLSSEARAVLGGILSFSYGTSRGHDTYGYGIVTAKLNGNRKGQAVGGGYDMKGSAFGQLIEAVMPAALYDLAQKRAGSVWQTARHTAKREHTDKTSRQLYRGGPVPNPNYDPNALYGLTLLADEGRASLDGACGFRSMEDVLQALGLRLQYHPTGRRDGVYLILEA